MDNIERAIASSHGLKTALDEEVARAQTQRVLIKNFDAEALLDRAAQRTRFNQQVKFLQQELANALRSVADEFGLTEVTIDSLTQVTAEPAGRLSATLGEIRALAGTLRELDTLNRHLAQRANAMVKGYLGALTGASSSYNQRGETKPYAASTYSGTA